MFLPDAFIVICLQSLEFYSLYINVAELNRFESIQIDSNRFSSATRDASHSFTKEKHHIRMK